MTKKFFLANILLFIVTICISVKIITSYRILYMDDGMGRFVVDLVSDNHSVSELDVNFIDLLKSLDQGGYLLHNARRLNVEKDTYSELIISLFRMNTRFFPDGTFCESNKFSLKSGDFHLNIILSDRKSILKISDSNFPFISDGVYLSCEVYNLIYNCK